MSLRGTEGPSSPLLMSDHPSPSMDSLCALPPDHDAFAKHYLEGHTTEVYLESINPAGQMDLDQYSGKVGELRRYLNLDDRAIGPQPIVVSVGVGSGDELLGLAHHYDHRAVAIHGVDLSSHALAATQARLQQHGVRATLIEGNATELPFQDGTVAGFVVSALLHEVYSYERYGKEGLRCAIAQLALKGQVGSKALIRDFAAPNLQGEVEVRLLSEEAKTFYELFSNYFRTFRGEGQAVAQEEFADVREPGAGDFPMPSGASDTTSLDINNLAEMLWHFRYAAADIEKDITIDDPWWKEWNERYLVPNPYLPEIKPMTAESYEQFITTVGRYVLLGSNQRLSVISSTVAKRPNTARFLGKHFALSMPGERNVQSDEILDRSTTKMELVISKDHIVD